MQKPGGIGQPPTNSTGPNVDQSLSSLVGNMSIGQQQQQPFSSQPYQFQPQWQAPTQQPMYNQTPQQTPFGNPYASSGAPFQPQQ